RAHSEASTAPTAPPDRGASAAATASPAPSGRAGSRKPGEPGAWPAPHRSPSRAVAGPGHGPSPQAQGRADLAEFRPLTFDPREIPLDDPDWGSLRSPSQFELIRARRRSSGPLHRERAVILGVPECLTLRYFDSAAGQLKEYAGCAVYPGWGENREF